MPVNHQKIKQIRAKLGFTQAEAAKRAGLTDRTHWNRIENGTFTDLRISTIEAVARALGVKAKDLLD